MGYIEEISVSDKVRWNEVVRNIKGYDVFYLHEYVYAFMKEDNSLGTPILLYYRNGADQGINVVFKRDIATDSNFRGKITEGAYFDLITPYGYGGFIGAIDDYEMLNETYENYCTQNQYICEFVRFNLFSEYYLHYRGVVESRTHNVVRELNAPIDEIWMDFKQKVRKNVKRANSYNLRVLADENGKYLDDFLRIYYGTMDRNEAGQQFYFKKEFFEHLISMADSTIFFHVVYEDKIISTELVLYGEDNCYSYLGGTDDEYFYTRANDFLKYEIIKWAKGKGLKTFVLGGGYGSDDGIFQYKLSLAPHGIRKFYIGKKIFDEKNYNKLVKLRLADSFDDSDTNMRSDFFPKYRV